MKFSVLCCQDWTEQPVPGCLVTKSWIADFEQAFVYLSQKNSGSQCRGPLFGALVPPMALLPSNVASRELVRFSKFSDSMLVMKVICAP